MKVSSPLSRLGAVILCGALAWAALPSSGSASPPDFKAIGAVPPTFLQVTGPAVFASRTASANLALPTSVMPNNAPKCSAGTSDPGAPPMCSAALSGGVVQRCSAHIDSQQQCSAFLDTAGAQAYCSTLGGTGPMCSVLQPAMNQNGPSQCSAFGSAPGKKVMCSVIGNGGKQFCSVENPAKLPGNQCSTFPSASGGSGGSHLCSVLNGGNTRKNFCSTINGAPAGTFTGTCSAFAPNSKCSILAGQKGQCTSLMGAPAGSCSAFAAGSFCSVIGGLPGTTTCP